MDQELLSIKALLISRMYLYEMFHKVMGGRPTRELCSALASPETLDAVDEYCGHSEAFRELKSLLLSLGESLDEPDRFEEFLGSVQDEYTRLYVGPGQIKAHPFETVFKERQPILFSTNTLAVRQAYAAYGYESAYRGRLPEDHVSIMCTFMSKLAEKTYGACADRRWSEVMELLEFQQTFAIEHMASWLTDFSRLQDKEERASFYPRLSEALSDFVGIDVGFLAEAHAWVKDQVQSGFDGSEGAISGDDSEPEAFAAVEHAFAKLREVRLLGLEENELREIA